MAITNEALRNEILTSVAGRRLGLDHNDFLVGPKAPRQEISAATTASTGTQINNYGFTTVAGGTATQTWVLAAPQDGVRKSFVSVSTSTKGAKITLASGSFNSTGGSSDTALTLHGIGQRVELIGVSTASYAVVSGVGFTST